MRPTLAPVTRDWVEGHQAALRKAAANAIDASNRWRQRDAELMVKLRAEKRNEYAIAQAKAADPELSDAYGSFSFFNAKVQLHSAALQGVLAAQALLADLPDGSAPVWPAAADRAVPRPSYRPRPYATDDVDDVRLAGLVEPAPLTDPALRDTNSPTGSSPAGLPHVSGPVGGKQGAAGAGVPAAPTPDRSRCPACHHEAEHLDASGCVAKRGGQLGTVRRCGCKYAAEVGA